MQELVHNEIRYKFVTLSFMTLEIFFDVSGFCVSRLGGGSGMGWGNRVEKGGGCRRGKN